MLYTLSELLALLVVTLGCALQARVGIGFGLLAAPLLFLLDPRYVPSAILLLGGCLSLLVVWKNLQGIVWPRVWVATGARFMGSGVGAWILLQLSPAGLSLFFGVALLSAVLLSGLKRHHEIALTKPNLLAGGFFSGVIGTATSIGGPPMALVYQSAQSWVVRSELAAFFLIGTPISLGWLWYQDLLGENDMLLSLKLLPGVVLGYGLSAWLGARDFAVLPHRFALLALSATSACVVIGKGLYAL